MKAFTDDQLARVKRDISGFRSWAKDDEVLALIYRMECAEALASHDQEEEGHYDLTQKWLASKGVGE